MSSSFPANYISVLASAISEKKIFRNEVSVSGMCVRTIKAIKLN